MKKKRRLRKSVKIIILLIFISIFLITSYKVINYYLELNKNNNDNKKLIEEVVKEVPSEDKLVEEKQTIIDFSKLLEINSDTKGWIKYNNSKINYPIVQTFDNEYYLNHAFNKSYNQAGSIFMDYRNISLEDKNVVLFGHSMLDDSMFSSLNDIFNQDFFLNEDNNIIEIRDLNNNILKYQVFSYYTIEKEEFYITTNFNNLKDYLDFLNIIKSRSYRNFNVNLNINDRILTLSTCSGVAGTTKRKVVHAKLMEVTQNNNF